MYESKNVMNEKEAAIYIAISLSYLQHVWIELLLLLRLQDYSLDMVVVVGSSPIVPTNLTL